MLASDESTEPLEGWQTRRVPKLLVPGTRRALPPDGTTQGPERDDILNIGGFSDAVFNVVTSYLGDDAARFVAEVESVEL